MKAVLSWGSPSGQYVPSVYFCMDQPDLSLFHGVFIDFCSSVATEFRAFSKSTLHDDSCVIILNSNQELVLLDRKRKETNYENIACKCPHLRPSKIDYFLFPSTFCKKGSGVACSNIHTGFWFILYKRAWIKRDVQFHISEETPERLFVKKTICQFALQMCHRTQTQAL